MASSESMISETDKKSAQKAYAVAGAMTRSIAARRFVTTARPATASISLASVSPGLFPLVLESLDPWHLARSGEKRANSRILSLTHDIVIR